MKNLNKIIWAISIMIFALTMPNKMLAQCFQAASSADLSINTTSSGGDYRINTSNDVFMNMHVWACDGGSANISWWDGSVVTGTHQLGDADALDPDIIVCKDQNGVFWALVAYYSQTNSKYVCENWKWDGSVFNLYSTNNLMGCDYGTAINIDADRTGDIVIVWDKPGDGIYMNYGNITGAGPIFHYTYNSACHLYAAGQMPDVAIYEDNNYTEVFYTFIDADLINLYVYKAPILTPTSTSISYTDSYLNCCSYCDGYLKYPRIACPPPISTATPEHYTVVYEEYLNDNSGFIESYICGYLSGNYGPGWYTHQCIHIDYPYEVGLVTYDIGNERPVVTYSSSYDGSSNGEGMIFAWTYDHTKPDDPDPLIEPIALQLDYNATYVTYPYLIIPSTQNTDDIQSSPSISGRWASNDNIFYTWYYYYGANPGNVNYKDVSWSSTALRQESINDPNQLKLGIYPNPSTGNFTINLTSFINEVISIEIYNSIGERIYSSSDIANSSYFNKEISLKDYDSGIYLVRTSGIESTNLWKLLLTK